MLHKHSIINIAVLFSFLLMISASLISSFSVPSKAITNRKNLPLITSGLMIWNLKTKKLVKWWENGSHVIFSNDESWVVTLFQDENGCRSVLWRLPDATRKLTFGCGPSNFSIDSRLLVGYISRTTLGIWDLTNQKLIKKIPHVPHDFNQVRFSKDGNFIIGAQENICGAIIDEFNTLCSSRPSIYIWALKNKLQQIRYELQGMCLFLLRPEPGEVISYCETEKGNFLTFQNLLTKTIYWKLQFQREKTCAGRCRPQFQFVHENAFILDSDIYEFSKQHIRKLEISLPKDFYGLYGNEHIAFYVKTRELHFDASTNSFTMCVSFIPYPGSFIESATKEICYLDKIQPIDELPKGLADFAFSPKGTYVSFRYIFSC